MPFRQANLADIHHGAHIMATAFQDGPILGRYLHPYREQHPDGMYLYFLRKLRLAYARGLPDDILLVTYDVNSSDKEQQITGFAHWHRKRAELIPRSLHSTAILQATKAYNYLTSLIWPNLAIEPSRAGLFQQIDPFISHHWAGSRAEVWMLELIAVDPMTGKKGYGRQMLEWGMQRAKEDGLACSLIAGKGAVGFYRRCGFDIEVGTLTDEGGDDNPMRRAGVEGGTIMFYEP
ncbi:hypothetical protein LTR78_007211 [Recurvomyces mirabilis]|uniref:N-acetyltransferase domain-containing protein n=1 Tax=Recurvomyces mirabilis TaxID=574656 RepID=A0AAE1BYN8_9PEZI|nr:hypothetical protein LTR78_007211 [Recurvomyces mirabilis]KAK5155546.1 hypothetical protein LTS14_005807 [Recurvomyces mirabilis]